MKRNKECYISLTINQGSQMGECFKSAQNEVSKKYSNFNRFTVY